MDIIKEKLEEAWEEQDIPKFNALLDLQKRYEEGEDSALNLFIIAEKQKKLNEVKKIIERIKEQEREKIPIHFRIAQVEEFLKNERKV